MFKVSKGQGNMITNGVESLEDVRKKLIQVMKDAEAERYVQD